MDRNKIQKMKAEVLDHIRNTPPEIIHQELLDSGLERHQNTKNAVSPDFDSDEPFEFVVWKGWVTEINDDGSYDAELIDMVQLGTREQATISDDEIVGNPDIQKGSVFIWVIMTSPVEAQSIQFQRDGKPEDPEVFEEIAYKAKQIATQLSKNSDDES